MLDNKQEYQEEYSENEGFVNIFFRKEDIYISGFIQFYANKKFKIKYRSCLNELSGIFFIFLNHSFSDEDPDVLNEQFDHSFFEGVMSEIKRINVFFKGIS